MIDKQGKMSRAVGLTAQLGIVGDKGQHALLSLLGIDVVLHVDRLELVLGRELLDLAVGNRAHERGLSAAVGAAEPVALATLQVQDSVVQQDLGTCHKIQES